MKKRRISKLSRVLSIYHLLLNCEEVTIHELHVQLPDFSIKTFQRDIALIRQVGAMVKFVKFDKQHKGYVLEQRDLSEMVPCENQAQQRILKRLRRLFIMLRYLPEEDCDIWYRETFPEMSKRTMQRDFAELNILGFRIRYVRELDMLGYDPDEPHPSRGRYMRDYMDAYSLDTFKN